MEAMYVRIGAKEIDIPLEINVHKIRESVQQINFIA
jgi:hypothetical protein